MSDDLSKCELCGEPLPDGETMFKFHGYSGPCPKPPMPKANDDLVERLNGNSGIHWELMREAAARIAAQDAEIAELKRQSDANRDNHLTTATLLRDKLATAEAEREQWRLAGQSGAHALT